MLWALAEEHEELCFFASGLFQNQGMCNLRVACGPVIDLKCYLAFAGRSDPSHHGMGHRSYGRRDHIFSVN